MKKCCVCKLDKDESEFGKDRNAPTGLAYKCKRCAVIVCKKWQKENEEHCRQYRKRRYETHGDVLRKRSRESTRRINLRDLYGITEEEYRQLYSSRDGGCWACGVKLPTLCVDHNHSTGEVRGLLCSRCNSGIGFLGDSIDGLEKAIAYLKKAEFVLIHKNSQTA